MRKRTLDGTAENDAAKVQYHSLAFDLLNTDNRQDYNSAAAFQATNNPESKLKHTTTALYISSAAAILGRFLIFRWKFRHKATIAGMRAQARKMARKLKKIGGEREIGNLFGHKSTSAVSATSFGQQPTHSFINESVFWDHFRFALHKSSSVVFLFISVLIEFYCHCLVNREKHFFLGS